MDANKTRVTSSPAVPGKKGLDNVISSTNRSNKAVSRHAVTDSETNRISATARTPTWGRRTSDRWQVVSSVCDWWRHQSISLYQYTAIFWSESPIGEIAVWSRAIFWSESSIGEIAVWSRAIFWSESPIGEIAVWSRAIFWSESPIGEIAVWSRAAAHAQVMCAVCVWNVLCALSV